MPKLPTEPGLYLWDLDGAIVYVGQTRMPLSARLGPNGYATISNYNTLARQPGHSNGGQQTNCRINALANAALASGRQLAIWYRSTTADGAAAEEKEWMRRFGKPEWNRRDEGSPRAPLQAHTRRRVFTKEGSVPDVAPQDGGAPMASRGGNDSLGNAGRGG